MIGSDKWPFNELLDVFFQVIIFLSEKIGSYFDFFCLNLHKLIFSFFFLLRHMLLWSQPWIGSLLLYYMKKVKVWYDYKKCSNSHLSTTIYKLVSGNWYLVSLVMITGIHSSQLSGFVLDEMFQRFDFP